MSLDKEVRNAYDERDIYRFNQIDRYALCFLNWRKGNIENALKLIDDTFRWRKERNIPSKYIFVIELINNI